MTNSKFKKFSEWISLFFVLLVAVTFISFGQITNTSSNKILNTALTTLGSLLLSAISLYTGSRLQEARATKKQEEDAKLKELDTYKSFVLQISETCSQLSQAKYEKSVNKKDAIILESKEKIAQLIKIPPSMVILSNLTFREKSNKTLNAIIRQCKNLAKKEYPSTQKLEATIALALIEIDSYQKEIRSI